MAFKEIMWHIQAENERTHHPLSEQIDFDKRRGFGVNGGRPGDKYYIPADAKIGGL